MPVATPGQERLIEELTAVVAVPFAKREGKASPQVPHALRDAVIVHPPNGLQLGPAGRDIDRHQRGEMKPRGGFAAMEDEIALDRAWPHAGPLAPSAHRDLGPERVQGG